MTKSRPGRQRDPEDAAPCLVLEGEKRGGVRRERHRLHAVAVIHADQGRDHDAEGEHPLKDSGALAAAGGRKAFGKVERNDDADQSAGHALEQTAEEQRAVSVRQRDDGDADDKGGSAEDHERLAAHPVGQEAGEESGEDRAQQHGRHDGGELRGGEVRGGFEVGICARNDAHVDAVEQAAQPRDQQKKETVSALRRSVCCRGRTDGANVCHRYLEVLHMRIIRQAPGRHLL